jgi:hypothetical protein
LPRERAKDLCDAKPKQTACEQGNGKNAHEPPSLALDAARDALFFVIAKSAEIRDFVRTQYRR